MIEQIKKALWLLVYNPIYSYRYWKTRSFRKNMHILNSEETIMHILSSHCSICRYGDGEFQMMGHYYEHKDDKDFYVDTFQKYNRLLAKRLTDVYQSTNNNVLVCLPYAFKDASVSNKVYDRVFWKREWLLRYRMLVNLGKNNFGDSTFTRFYMGRGDIKDYSAYIKLLKKIWDAKDVIIVEGEQSRLGVGNDLFNNTLSIQRILCPPTNAFDCYESILKTVEIEVSKDKLILVALGHTATILAHDLSLSGYQAIDIGHIDIEYEWYLMKAKHKVPIPHKYVNEVKFGRVNTECNDSVYNSQILKIIR